MTANGIYVLPQGSVVLLQNLVQSEGLPFSSQHDLSSPLIQILGLHGKLISLQFEAGIEDKIFVLKQFIFLQCNFLSDTFT